MKALLERLGNPERRVQAIHVVGTNGKSTTTRMIEALLLEQGVLAGAYVSPHVVRWSERIRVGGEEADVAAAGATAAAVEAGLGGRLDATNVLETVAVVLTNVGLEHTNVLGSTREAIAAEKLAVVKPGCGVGLGEPGGGGRGGGWSSRAGPSPSRGWPPSRSSASPSTPVRRAPSRFRAGSRWSARSRSRSGAAP